MPWDLFHFWVQYPDSGPQRFVRKHLNFFTMDKNLKIILQKENLQHLQALFTRQNITDSILSDLTDDCLVDLGIEKMGDRQRLLSAFRHVSEQLASGGSFMVKIDGGTLSDDSMLAGEKVDTFLIGKYPVMFAEWERVKVWGASNGYEFKAGQAGGGAHLLSKLVGLMLRSGPMLKVSNLG